MKTSKDKKADNKFDLTKMKVAKLKNMHLISGGGGGETVTVNKPFKASILN
jgi:hypothetical protein